MLWRSSFWDEYSKYWAEDHQPRQTGVCPPNVHIKICIFHLKITFSALGHLYLVTAHVVTSVHDDWLSSLVVLSNVQAGFGAKIFQLVCNTNERQTLTYGRENIYSI